MIVYGTVRFDSKASVQSDGCTDEANPLYKENIQLYCTVNYSNNNSRGEGALRNINNYMEGSADTALHI
jgi:hypothetical protein